MLLPSPILRFRATKWKSITRSTMWRAIRTIFATPFASGPGTRWRAVIACRCVICPPNSRTAALIQRLIKRRRHRRQAPRPRRRAHRRAPDAPEIAAGPGRICSRATRVWCVFLQVSGKRPITLGFSTLDLESTSRLGRCGLPLSAFLVAEHILGRHGARSTHP